MTISDRGSPFSTTNEHGLYVPNDPYSTSELSAMAYHGMLRPQFGPFYVAADMPDTASQRAKSVRMVGERILSGDWTATLLTAAWIHLGGQAPELFEAASGATSRQKKRSRIMPAAIRQLDYLDRTEVSEDDLHVIGGVIVTSPELTIVDLLRIGHNQRHQAKAAQLLDRVDHQALRQRLCNHEALPGMDTAQQIFESLVLAHASALEHMG